MEKSSFVRKEKRGEGEALGGRNPKGADIKGHGKAPGKKKPKRGHWNRLGKKKGGRKRKETPKKKKAEQ